MDEGVASTDNVYPVFYGERSIRQVKFKCRGTPGHGSLLVKGNVGVKVLFLVDKFMDMRKHEEVGLDTNPGLCVGDVTSVNLEMMEGGLQANVVPVGSTVRDV